MSERILHFTVAPENAGQRLDKFLADAVAASESLSRTRLKDLILSGALESGGVALADPSAKLKEGMEFTLRVPPAADAAPAAQEIALDIVYEDEALLVLNKQAGLVVHPGAGHGEGTLVNALLHHCADSLSGIGGVKRPGIVHRLDKDTTGLMLVAKTDQAHHHLSAQLAERSLSRTYQTLVWRVPQPAKGRVDAPVGRHHVHRQKMTVNRRNGKQAVTHFRTLGRFGETAALLECKLESGRTHQIRVHMQALGHPVIGDPLYGLQQTGARSLLKRGGYEAAAQDFILGFPRQALHAWHIEFIHPLTEEAMAFEAELPPDMQELLKLLKNNNK
jgi:23S rRNA pseudouridine1911/1915/1917 synthase